MLLHHQTRERRKIMMYDQIDVSLDIQVYDEDSSMLYDFLEAIKMKVYDALIEKANINKNISSDKIEVNRVNVDIPDYKIEADVSILDEKDNKIIDAVLTWRM